VCMENEKRLETARELAGRYGLTPRTVLKWASAGLIPVAVKVGSVVRFDPDAVADALAELTERALDECIGADEEGGEGNA